MRRPKADRSPTWYVRRSGYWTAVLELAALVGELSRAKSGWVEATELPVPFAIRFPGGQTAAPAKLAQRIVEGGDPLESMATEVEPLSPPAE